MCSFFPSFVPSFVRLFVYSFVPSFLRRSSSSLWSAFTLTVHINAYIMKVYIEKNNIQVELIRFRKNSAPIDFANFEVGLYFRDRCAHGIRDESSLFGSEAPGAPDVSRHDHFGTECRSMREFGSLIRYSSLRL